MTSVIPPIPLRDLPPHIRRQRLLEQRRARRGIPDPGPGWRRTDLVRKWSAFGRQAARRAMRDANRALHEASRSKKKITKTTLVPFHIDWKVISAFVIGALGIAIAVLMECLQRHLLH